MTMVVAIGMLKIEVYSYDKHFPFSVIQRKYKFPNPTRLMGFTTCWMLQPQAAFEEKMIKSLI